MLSSDYEPDIAVSALCELSHFILSITLQVRNCSYFHFTGEITEGQTWGMENLELKHKKFD